MFVMWYNLEMGWAEYVPKTKLGVTDNTHDCFTLILAHFHCIGYD